MSGIFFSFPPRSTRLSSLVTKSQLFANFYRRDPRFCHYENLFGIHRYKVITHGFHQPHSVALPETFSLFRFHSTYLNMVETTPAGVLSFSKASVMISQNIQDMMLSTPGGVAKAEHTGQFNWNGRGIGYSTWAEDGKWAENEKGIHGLGSNSRWNEDAFGGECFISGDEAQSRIPEALFEPIIGLLMTPRFRKTESVHETTRRASGRRSSHYTSARRGYLATVPLFLVLMKSKSKLGNQNCVWGLTVKFINSYVPMWAANVSCSINARVVRKA